MPYKGRPVNGKKKPKQSPSHDNTHLTTDPRFSHVHKDPRFTRPRRKDFKVTIDNRFAGMLKNRNFSDAPKVDKYGRPLKISAEDELKKFYRIENEGDENDIEDEEDEEESENLSVAELEREIADEEEDEGDENGVFDPMRGKGIMFSESDSSEDEIEDDDANDEMNQQEDSEEESQIPTGEETNRFAVVNIDWDHVKSLDLLKIFTGFKPDNGVIREVKIYPSELGKQRLAKEEVEGPPKEIFKDYKKEDDYMDSSEEIDAKALQKAQADNGNEFDMSALRRYQLDRLRYYYAVVECDTVETARAIYTACDGAEYERSANFFDLRYIPNGMKFDDEPRDQAHHAPENYKPLDFQTDALQHSKVKLTWDEEDPDRARVTHRKFTAEDLKDMDFKAYLASSSEEDSAEDTETARKRYRKLLISENNEDEENVDEEGEMEITFTPGLSETIADKKKTEKLENETNIEQYIRKQKEKKKARKALKKGVSKDSENEGIQKPFSDDDIDIDASDPFFTEILSKSNASRSKKPDKKRKSKEERIEDVRKKAELELLFADEQDQNEGFNLKQMMKAEKAKVREKKKRGDNTTQEDDEFELDVNDPRFAAVGLNHEYAIDPTNPHFKKTTGMKKLLQANRVSRGKNEEAPQNKENTSKFADPSLSQLIDSVKRKSTMATMDEGGKRKKKKLG